MVTRGEDRVSRGPILPNFLDLLHARTQYEKQTTNCCVVIKLGVKKILTGRSQMLMRDLFAVANLIQL